MKTITINLYKFSELSESAKQKAIAELSDINVSNDWWEYNYEDAKQIGLKITGFDLDRGNYAKGKIIGTAEETALLIKENHGPETDTFKLAEGFLLDLEKLELKPESKDRELMIEDLEEYFLKELLGDYLYILKKEYEYRTSKEAIIETIESNDYDFTENGDLY
jgi:hypothetical protein